MARRLFRKVTGAVLLSLAATIATAQTPAPVPSDQAMQRLMDGNARFQKGQPTHPREDPAQRRLVVAQGQHPFATILSCADSRVPVEEVFDQGIGDVFVVRVAGNVAATDEIGTIEYGAGHLGIPLLVVLGHSKCGAVTAVVQGDKAEGDLAALLSHIGPAAQRAKADHPDLRGDELVAQAIRDNVWQSIRELLTQSHELRELVAAGKLKVVGAVYDLESGSVTWMGPHPQQEQLLKASAEPHTTPEPKAADPGAANPPPPQP